MILPSIGQMLRIKLNADSKENFQSRFIEMDDQYLLIDVPLSKNGSGLMTDQNTELWIEFHARDGAVCRFSAVYLESVRTPGLVWKVSRPEASSFQKEQRREFVRVPADLNVTLYYGENGQNKATVFTTDISGGGMAILAPKNVTLSVGRIVQAQFTLPTDKSVFTVRCFVVRVGDRNERGYASVSLQFVDVNESLRRKIIQYTFARQRQIGRS